MKWLCACLAVLFMVAPAMAGEDPYISIVGNDKINSAPYTFYYSGKYAQFMYDQDVFAVPACDANGWDPVLRFTSSGAPVPGTGPSLAGFQREAGTPSTIPGAIKCESFYAQTPAIQAEVCDTLGGGAPGNWLTRGKLNAKTPAGNSGWYEWWIRLPKKPSGEINIVIQCGVLKPNAFTVYGFNAIDYCAAETGERIGVGTCVRQEVDPGVSPVQNAALPKLTAVAYPGPYNQFTPFNLTAFKNPSAYTLAFDPVTSAMSNNTNSQILDGSANARILLKACMDKAVLAKLPVTGQINANNQTEVDLEQGDLIYVRMDVPRQNSVDVYCHAQSARIMGVGEAPF